MTYYQQITIYIENNNSYSMYFAYNQNTTFKDLFEFIIYNYPEKNICPCYKMQYYHNSNGTYYDLTLNENVYNYINNNSYNRYNFEKIKNYSQAQHESHKGFFKMPKFHINNILNKYMKNLERQINNKMEEKNFGLYNLGVASENDFLNEIPSLEYNDYFDEESEEQKEFIDFLNSIFYQKGLNNLIQKFNTRIDNIKSKIQKYKEEIDKLKKDSKILIEQINGDIDINRINKLSSMGIKENIKPRLNLLRLDPQTNQFIGNETAIKKDFTNFYDIIIDIKSMKSICNGWEIKKSKRIENNYEQFNKDEVIVIGVIGNSNKGKSFILSKISKVKDIPSGSSIRTEGLSVKYPELDTYQDRKMVLLDSAGLETPVLNEELEQKESKKDEENNNNKEKKEEKTEKKEEKEEKEEKEKEIEKNKNSGNNKEEKKEEKATLDELKNKDEIKLADENIQETPKKDINEIFKENSRDKLITELFLQNYIMNQSDILIIVVGILTYSEQKMLCKIKNEILSSKEKKPLYIIHNLMTYTTIEQVEEYISNCLLKSSTFSLKLGHKISTKTQRKSGIYYYEKISGNEIYHLIFANEGSEAGNFYNNLTLDFIENSYQRVINIKSYDAIKTVKEQFIKMSSEIIEKTEKPLTLEFDETNNNYIKLKNPEKITLKCCSINELGISNLVSNGFEPTYNLYKNGNKMILKIESGGNSKIFNANLLLGQGENTSLIVTGEKKRDKEPKNLEDNIFNSRKFGKFYLNIPIKGDYIIKNEMPNISEKKGILFIEYILDDKITGGKYEPEEEI